MGLTENCTTVMTLGNRRYANPGRSGSFIDGQRVLVDPVICEGREPNPLTFEKAGPTKEIFFDPTKTRAGIVTTGGVCPGWNNVIRALVRSLYNYGVKSILGFQYGQQGFVAKYEHATRELTPENVDHIHNMGGTILGTSRGRQDEEEIVDCLYRLGVNILYVLGGDGSLRGALDIAETAEKRGMALSVIGVPKTIDNDTLYTKSFGFDTAVSNVAGSIYTAHVEARNSPYGVAIVKTMGRHSGFLAAHSACAQGEANFCLVPEVQFSLDGDNGLLEHIRRRFKRQHREGSNEHVVIVAAEGAGQGMVREKMLAEGRSAESLCDASGNKRLLDIGDFLKEEIEKYLVSQNIEPNVKLIVPGYNSRSVPANSQDAVFCMHLGAMAAHAGMSGKTKMLVGYRNAQFVNVPISTATKRRKVIDTQGELWQTVLQATNQPDWPTAKVND